MRYLTKHLFLASAALLVRSAGKGVIAYCDKTESMEIAVVNEVPKVQVCTWTFTDPPRVGKRRQ